MPVPPAMKGTAMSFRGNLPCLRSTRGMTQEQLAALLDVSVQSVNAWERGTASPSVEQLLALSDLFGCTVDDLVRGDLPRVDGAPVPRPSLGGTQDSCGYDRHSRTFARRISLGVVALLVGIVLPAVLNGPGSGGVFQRPDAPASAIALVGLAASLAIIIPTARTNGAFIEAHPRIRDFYTQDDRDRASALFVWGVIASLAISVVGYVVFCILLAGTPLVHCFLLCLAAGITMFTYAALMRMRVDIDTYNRTSAR